jgi:hypothetical protein
MANPKHGVKIPGVGKCIRPGGHCPEYHLWKSEGKIMSDDAKTPEVLEKDDPRVAALALEKELKEFSGGLAYDQARVIERTQDGFRQGVHGFYMAGLGLILLHQHDGDTFTYILEQYFPGTTYEAAKKYMRFARAASTLPNFKQFCLERGGYSKGLTMLQSCSQEQIEEFEETGELLGYNPDQIDKMSVLTLKKALRRAREKMDQAVMKATDKVLQENVNLREQVDELAAALAAPDLEAAKKLIRAAGTKIYDALELLRKVNWELVSRDWTLRLAVLQKTNHIGNVVQTIEAEILSREMPEPPAKEGDGE